MEKGIIVLKQPKDDQLIKIIKIESPLDLTIKPITSMSDVHIHSPLKKRYRDTDNIENFSCDSNLKDTTPIKKRYRDENQTIKTEPIQEIKQEKTPKRKSLKLTVNIKASKNHPKANLGEKSSKAIRKLKFDEFRSSPVSGEFHFALEISTATNLLFDVISNKRKIKFLIKYFFSFNPNRYHNQDIRRDRSRRHS